MIFCIWACFNVAGSCRVLFEDSLGMVDFCPAQTIGVVYVTEADLVSGQGYKRKLAKLRMVSLIVLFGYIQFHRLIKAYCVWNI